MFLFADAKLEEHLVQGISELRALRCEGLEYALQIRFAHITRRLGIAPRAIPALIGRGLGRRS